MPYCVSGLTDTREDVALANMFRERKRVFIDLLQWDVPVLADSFEVDQFDTASATYLLLAGPDGCHKASLRLLPTLAPNLLASIFPELCDGAPPRAGDILEISRFCLSRDLRAVDRRRFRNALVTMAVRFALDRGVRGYCCVADIAWLEQIPSFGWRCRSLGVPRRLACGVTGAMLIEIDERTPDRMAAAGTWMPELVDPPTWSAGSLAPESDHVLH